MEIVESPVHPQVVLTLKTANSKRRAGKFEQYIAYRAEYKIRLQNDTG